MMHCVVRFGLLAMVLHVTAFEAAGESAAMPPTSSITLQPYACCAVDEAGHNRIAFKADGSRFAAPMGKGELGIFTVQSEPKPLNAQDLKRYEALVILLDDEHFHERSKAMVALRAMGTSVRPLLEESLRKTESLESRIRLEELLHNAFLSIQTVHLKKVLSSLVRSVKYSPDGKQLLVAGYGDSIKLLDAGNLQETMSIPTTDNVTDALFLNKGDGLAASIKNQVQFWSSRTGEQWPFSLTHTGNICCLDASPDELLLAVSGGETGVSIWDLKTRQRVHTLKDFGTNVGHVEFSPDGKYLACASGDGNVTVWDVPTFQLRHTLKGHKESVYHVVFSRDGLWLASTGKKGDVIIWDPANGQRLATNDDRDEYCTPTFSPDGKFLLTLETGKIRLWRITKANIWGHQ